jgi:hypothetical protein
MATLAAMPTFAAFFLVLAALFALFFFVAHGEGLLSGNRKEEKRGS